MYMISTALQQIIYKRISFPEERINHANKSGVNKTFQLKIDAIRSVDEIEKVESIISQKKTILKNTKDVHESDNLFTELDALEWFQWHIAVYALVDGTRKEGANTKK